MSLLSAVRIPLLNPNEIEASLVTLTVKEKQSVQAGDTLAILETTKSTGELNAEEAGFIIGLRFKEGDLVRAGEVLCYLAENPELVPPQNEIAALTPVQELQEGQVPQGLRITRPALTLARQSGLNLEHLPLGPLVTESMVRRLLDPVSVPTLAPTFDPTALIVYGGGGHGKSLIELIRALGSYQLAGVVDDGLSAGEDILGVPVLGGGECLAELAARGVRLAVNAVGGIGNPMSRIKVFERLVQVGFVCPVVIHPTAFVEASARLSAGVQVFAHAYVGSSAHVGTGTIVNTGAIISHDCKLGDYANISPGTMLAGMVEIGDKTLVGMGVTINLEVKIGAGARIGNSATVKTDVPAGGVVRAGTIWPA